jgi:SSS family solute:Na+ symporter/sodium/pantothenate symporter
LIKQGKPLFLPLGIAVSFFFVWPIGGIGTPASMVRVMACKSNATLRRSIVLLSGYNLLIYLPLIIICICGRALMPNVTPEDEIIPRLAIWSAQDFSGGSLLSGLILAAPFGAVMATVSTYLVVIASGVVRDIYQRFLRPRASDIEVRRVSHAVMIVFGLIGVAANIQPVDFLQKMVVFSTTSTASTFVVPALMLAFWRRATAAGAMAGMVGGACAVLALFSCGPLLEGKKFFDAYQLLGLDPIVWGLAASAVAALAVTAVSSPPQERVVSRLFDEESAAARGPVRSIAVGEI